MPPGRKNDSMTPSFEGMEPEPKPVRNLNSRNAFGRAISLRYYSISPETLSEVASEDIELVDADHLETALYNVPNGSFNVNGLSLNENEYTTIVRNPESFGKAILAQTFSARGLDTDQDRRSGAAQRSVLDAFATKEEVITAMLQGYRQEEDWLTRLRKEMSTPGYAHMSELTMRGLVTNVMHFSFENLLDVASNEFGWDDETRRAATNAVTYRLLTGPQKDKVAYWKQLTDLCIKYNHAKQVLSRSKLSQIRHNLR